jgi:hypothetical protein
MLVSCLTYFLALKIVMKYSSETSVHFQRATRRYIPEGRPRYKHRSENLKSYTILILKSGKQKWECTFSYSFTCPKNIEVAWVIGIEK